MQQVNTPESRAFDLSHVLWFPSKIQLSWNTALVGRRASALLDRLIS